MKKTLCAIWAVPLLFLLVTTVEGQRNPVSGPSAGSGQTAVPFPLSFHIAPGLNIPLGEYAPYYTVGGGGGFSVEYRLQPFPLVYFKGDLGYNFDPVKTNSLSVLTLGAGSGLRFDFTPWLTAQAFATGGVYAGFLNDTSRKASPPQIQPMVSAGANVSFHLTPAFGIGVGASYDYRFGLYSGIKAFLGASYTLGAESKRVPKILIGDVEFQDVFPVFCNYYDTHPIGRVTIQTEESEPLTDVRVTFFIKQYMDAPKDCAAPGPLRKGEPRTVDLNALFTGRILDITEATKAAGEISVQCLWLGEPFSQTKVVSVRMENRNAMTWDDDRKAAAFVTSMDPVVQTFSKNLTAIVREKGGKAVDPKVLTAMTFHEALRVHGVSYVSDPASSYADKSKKANEIDFLQFPRQTLEFRGGDCDDLSILYCALLESVGMETAFLTLPGHIFMAFALDMDPAEAGAYFAKQDELILHGGKVWLPIEVTARGDGFMKAWEIGAREWREGSRQGQAGFFPVREAWSDYEPVGFPSSGGAVNLPAQDRIEAGFTAEIERFLQREAYPRIEEAQKAVGKSQDSPRLLNKLGVLYGKFAMTDKAIGTFQAALAREEFMPALLNLGTVYLFQGEKQKALEAYTRALGKEPQNANALLGAARVSYELENAADTASFFQRLKQADPVLAEKFAYLGKPGEDAKRAADAGAARGKSLWADD